MQRGARGVGGDAGGRGPHGALAVHGGLRDGAVEAVLRDRRERLRGRGRGVQHARGRGDGAGAAGGRGEPRGGGDVRGGLGAVGRARARLTEWAHHAGGLPLHCSWAGSATRTCWSRRACGAWQGPLFLVE